MEMVSRLTGRHPARRKFEFCGTNPNPISEQYPGLQRAAGSYFARETRVKASGRMALTEAATHDIEPAAREPSQAHLHRLLSNFRVSRAPADSRESRPPLLLGHRSEALL